jgi:uncharacterized glyoxalase superfamily metalloenzyme YdcJ
MTARAFVPPDAIRAAFSRAMSAMYRAEVPLYGTLIEIVAQVNERALDADPGLRERLEASGEIARLNDERHGAIRVGTGAELALLRRLFAVMGMAPVGYYDLAPASLPVHSTAFRPIAPAALAANAFRIFCSLLRVELIADAGLRTRAADILAGRAIVSDAALDLIAHHERDGGLDEASAEQFVAQALETFRWHAEALVDADTYAALHGAHRLIADIVCFRGPHINHLTPRTLDIDAVQAEMIARGISAKAVIEGPPPRHMPILLRQTSFAALEERILFRDGDRWIEGAHTARFGEIEQRGAALTPNGRALYDALLARVAPGPDQPARLAAAFADFPDDGDALRREGIAYVRYMLTPAGEVARAAGGLPAYNAETLIEQGLLRAEPITYEDFLPVSAAGIFRSNLGELAAARYDAASSQAAFEAALGCAVIDPFTLYEAQEAASLAAIFGRIMA